MVYELKESTNWFTSNGKLTEEALRLAYGRTSGRTRQVRSWQPREVAYTDLEGRQSEEVQRTECSSRSWGCHLRLLVLSRQK